MANELVIQPGEKILFEDPNVVWIKSWLSAIVGRLCLTTQRVFLEEHLQRQVKDVVIDIPRDALDKVERGMWRKHTNVLVIRTESEKFTILVGKPVEDWQATLRQAMHDDQTALEHVLERLKPKVPPPPYR